MSSEYVIEPQMYCGSSNINPAVFVAVDSAVDYSLVIAGSAGRPVGISAPYVKYPPGSGIGGANSGVAFEYSTAASVVVNDAVSWYGPGSTCLLTVGTGGWTRGNLLGPDSLNGGTGVVVTSAGNAVGAIAVASASAGAWQKVLVVFAYHP